MRNDLANVAIALQTLLLAPWSTEQFESYDGSPYLVIMHPASEPATYVVSSTRSGFALTELVDDELRPLQQDLGLDALLSRMARLTACVDTPDHRAA